MKRMLAFIFVIIFFYYGTLLLFGRKKLSTQIRDSTHSTWNKYKWTNDINVISNLEPEPFGSIFNDSNVRINFILATNFEEFKKYYFQNNVYSYLVIVDSKYIPYVKVEESEHIEEYAADWEREYIWCFFYWIVIKDEMTGIS